MNELDNLEIEDLLEKVEHIREILLGWKKGLDFNELKNAINNLQILELDYYLSSIQDEQTLMMVINLFCYKLFAKINLKLKKIINEYKKESKRLVDIQTRLNFLDKSSDNFNDKFFFDKSSPEDKEESSRKNSNEKNKKMN